MDWYKNERLSAILELMEECWPVINDYSKPIDARVSTLDDMIHMIALFSGRIKQDKLYGRMMLDWELIHGTWTNISYLNDPNKLLESGSTPNRFQRFKLADGTLVIIEDDMEDSLNILSPEERNQRRTLFAQKWVLPLGKWVYDCGVSDDRDISPQYVFAPIISTPQRDSRSHIKEEEFG